MFVTLKLQILVCNCFNIKTDCWKKNGEYVVSSVGIEPALVEVQLTRPRVIYVFIGWQCPPTNYELNLNTDSFSSFKSSLFKYYESSLYLCYNVDDPRSYKTICTKCNSVRSLTTSLSCCM